MTKKIFFVFVLIIASCLVLMAQEAGVDTTDIRYRIGYKIGSYLPITIILILAILFIRKAFRFKEDEK